MKRILILILASLLVMLYSSSADNTNKGQSIMVFQGLPAPEVLAIYEKMSGLEFVVDSRAKTVSSPISLKLINSPPLPKDEAMKQMRHALLTQAGIVITEIDDKRVSVTYNDTLPITK